MTKSVLYSKRGLIKKTKSNDSKSNNKAEAKEWEDNENLIVPVEGKLLRSI